MTALWNNIPGGLKFLFLATAAYVAVALFNPSYAGIAFQRFAKNLLHILPVLFFVFSFIFLINWLIRPATIRKHLGTDSGLKGMCYALLASILIAGPPYVLMPFFGELQKQGMKNSLIVLFFSNRNVQPPFIPVMIYYFGIRFTLILSLYILIVAVVNGLVLSRFLDPGGPVHSPAE